MQLSKHFVLNEFEKSMTATRFGIENKAGIDEIKCLTDLCYEVLEPVRAKFEKPIIITSGFRCLELNRKIGSSNFSHHIKGQAVDFEINSISNLEVAYWIKNNCNFYQLILEYWKKDDANAGWIHCSFIEGENKKQVLIFDGKKYTSGLPDLK